MATIAQRVWFARAALTLLKWEWFAGAGIGRNRDERQLIPPLLFNLYLAHKAGKKLSKREACKLMHVDFLQNWSEVYCVSGRSPSHRD